MDLQGLDEVLSKLNQTSIEMDRERRVYREELLKSCSKEQNAILKLQNLSDLLVIVQKSSFELLIVVKLIVGQNQSPERSRTIYAC